MNFPTLFFLVYFFVGFVFSSLNEQVQSLQLQLRDAQEALLSCASNNGLIIILDNETIPVDCVRAPSWSDYSVDNRIVLKRTHQWIMERNRALDRLRHSKPPQVGWMVVPRTSK